MRKRTAVLALLALVGTLLAAGCAPPRDGASGAARAPTTPDPAVAGPSGPALAGATTTAAGPPLRLQVQGLEVGEGICEITALVTVAGRAPAPPTLRLDLPAGAALLSGSAQETLALPQIGEALERRFRVRRPNGSIRVTLAAASTGGGFHAEAFYPPQVQKPSTAASPSTVAVPRVKLQGVTVERAVPIGPAAESPPKE